MAEIGDWFSRIPPVTRYWFGASVAVPVLCRFNVFSPYSMLLTTDFIKNLHLWKPLTSVLYCPLTGNRGFHYLVSLYFLYNYSQRLELGHFGGRMADYIFMMLFNWLALVVSKHSSNYYSCVVVSQVVIISNHTSNNHLGNIVCLWSHDANGSHDNQRFVRLLHDQPG